MPNLNMEYMLAKHITYITSHRNKITSKEVINLYNSITRVEDQISNKEIKQLCLNYKKAFNNIVKLGIQSSLDLSDESDLKDEDLLNQN